MNPQLAQKLMSEVPEMKEFVAYVIAEVQKLNTLSNITWTDNGERTIALVVLSRQIAIDTLTNILVPLLNTQQSTLRPDPKEYVV